MNGATYYVETCFYSDDTILGPSKLFVDHSSGQDFGELEAAQDFAREWVKEDESHKAFIYRKLETIEHQEVSDE